MNVNNNLQGLQQLFPSPDVARAESGAAQSGSASQVQSGTDQATLSPVASLAASAAPDSDVRMDKVAEVQQALVSGTYSVPASEVAGRMIDHMLGK
jgi:flagellar biosynthesis anti-sigma factor FlgM